MRAVVQMTLNGEALGSPLADNSYETDGYRFHDIFHLALACILGWSPVLRALLHVKRKSDAQLDEIEDGGRAIAIEEGIAALVFSYASQHSLLAGVTTIDWSLLRTCSEMTVGFEVQRKPLFASERTILKAFGVWRDANKYGGVRITCDLPRQSFDLSHSVELLYKTDSCFRVHQVPLGWEYWGRNWAGHTKGLLDTSSAGESYDLGVSDACIFVRLTEKILTVDKLKRSSKKIDWRES